MHKLIYFPVLFGGAYGITMWCQTQGYGHAFTVGLGVLWGLTVGYFDILQMLKSR